VDQLRRVQNGYKIRVSSGNTQGEVRVRFRGRDWDRTGLEHAAHGTPNAQTFANTSDWPDALTLIEMHALHQA